MIVPHEPPPLDALILGGGIAGLWILDELTRAGHACALAEPRALGAGQTVWSQGIIHGGLKYTLSGAMNPSAEAIREMPAIWRACIKGEREPDLSGAPPRTDHCHLWRTGAVSSIFGMIGARIGLRVAPVPLSPEQRPAVLRACPGTVARLDEQVIDPGAVLRVLASRHPRAVVHASLERAETSPSGGVTAHLRPANGPAPVEVRARRLILAAGNGNGSLRAMLGLAESAVQVRPLRMAMLRGGLPALHGHCVDGARTRLTITSARDSAGRTVWQIGGEVAERGAEMSPLELLRFARREVLAVLPGLRLEGCEWSSYDAPRAEVASPGGRRPDDASVLAEGPVLTVFPTKLALAPRLAALVAGALGPPIHGPGGLGALAGFDRPPVAAPPWDEDEGWTPDGDLP